MKKIQLTIDDAAYDWVKKQPSNFNLSKHVREMLRKLMNNGDEELVGSDGTEDIEPDEPFEDPTYDNDETQEI
jgi:hypothetical protein